MTIDFALQPPVPYDELLTSVTLGDVPGVHVDDRFPPAEGRVLLTSGTGALELWRREEDQAGFVFRSRYGDGVRTVLEVIAIFTGSKVQQRSGPEQPVHRALRA